MYPKREASGHKKDGEFTVVVATRALAAVLALTLKSAVTLTEQ